MAEWLIEQGIAEERALLIEGEQVLAAKLHWPGEPYSGQVLDAKLISKPAGAKRGVALAADGTELLVDKLPQEIAEGSAVRVMLTRAPMAENGRYKRAQGRIADSSCEDCGSPLADLPGARVVRRFPGGLWEDVWAAAEQGEMSFPGGSLLFSVTPAMTLVDVDGEGSPRELALAAIPALARALRWFDLGGSIGIDFPTIPDKAGRKAVDDALAMALGHWPHERTAMNGFGFVQLVSRLDGPSLLHRMAHSRVGAAARMALRRGEKVEEPGAVLLTVHPAVKGQLKPEWLAELARRTGREVRITADPILEFGGGFAQSVPL